MEIEKKIIIAITGSSTAGKSTFGKILIDNEVMDQKIYPIPQSKKRKNRKDDFEELMEKTQETEFSKDEFICSNHGYGIRKKYIKNFQNSQLKLATCVIGSEDIPQLKEKIKKYSNIKVFAVLLRLAENDIDKEKALLKKRTQIIFDGQDITQRLINQEWCIDHFYFKKEYVEKNIDLILFQENKNTPYEWLQAIEKSLSVKLIKDGFTPKQKIRKIMELTSRVRGLKKENIISAIKV